MFGLIKALFTGGATSAMENIATEWIETNKEKAEASAVMVKTLDPNGKMRRDLSNRITALYTLYIITTLVLLTLESFGVGPVIDGVLAISTATEKVTELFAPITTLFGVIVSASFGVNYANTKQCK